MIYPLVVFMAQDFRLKAAKHAELEHPKEAAGLVVNGSYFPCRNIADDPENSFVIDPVDYARAMALGAIEAIVHSHPQGTPISHYDYRACMQTKIRWYVYSVPSKEWWTIKP
jgi:proteasome lid subunit RPN8/RPN11